jgi:hypothetical protein
MISPSPTPPPVQTPPDYNRSPASYQAQQQVAQTPAKQRTGQTPAARLIKAILRPILKIIYYIIRWIRSHKLASLVAVILLVVSIFLTSYVVTGSMPLFTNSNSALQSMENNPQVSPAIGAWLNALQTGDIQTMLNEQKNLSTAAPQPDSALYILEFSQSKAGTTWTNATVTSIHASPDGLVDTFVEVDMTQPTSNGTANLVTLWHFTTLPDGTLLEIDYVSSRASSNG